MQILEVSILLPFLIYYLELINIHRKSTVTIDKSRFFMNANLLLKVFRSYKRRFFHNLMRIFWVKVPRIYNIFYIFSG